MCPEMFVYCIYCIITRRGAVVVFVVVGTRLQIKNLKLAYLKSFWNILDIVVLLMAICCIIFNIYRTVEVNNI